MKSSYAREEERRLLIENPPNVQVERLAGKFMDQVMRESPDHTTEQQENIARRCAAEEIVAEQGKK